MKRILFLTVLTITALCVPCHGKDRERTPKSIKRVEANENHFKADTNMKENLNLSQKWDKVFPQSDKVNHSKVTFRNRYGITLAADLYIPKKVEGKLPAIAVCGPFGAVKEQSSGLYAQTMAERGFLTIAFDPSFTGESGRRTPLRGVAGHQHGRLLRGSRISSRHATTSIQNESALSVFAAGEGWRSTQPLSTLASKQR